MSTSSSSPLSCGGMMHVNTYGVVMSYEEILQQRLRKGLCQTCQNDPVQCYEIKRHPLIPLKTVKEPLTIEGRVNKGICLRCFPAMDPRRTRERQRKWRRRTTGDDNSETTDCNSLPVTSCRCRDSSTTCASRSDGSSATIETTTTIATGDPSSSGIGSLTISEISSSTTTTTAVDADSSTNVEQQPTCGLSTTTNGSRSSRNRGMCLAREKGLRCIQHSTSDASSEGNDPRNDGAAPLHA